MSIKKILFTILITLLAISCTKKRKLDTIDYLSSFKNQASDAINIVFTSNIEGYIAPCGCTSDPLGGIDRFARIFDDISLISKKKPLLIDTGNLFFDGPTRNDADLCTDNAKTDFLLKSLKRLDLKFTLMRKFDTARGQNYYLNHLKNNNVELINNNKAIIYDDKKIYFLTTTDNIDRIKKQPNDIIILISNLSLAETKNSFGSSDKIDIIIQAESTDMSSMTPTKLNNNAPVIVSGGRQGQYFSVITLQNFKNKKNGKFIFDNRAMEQIQNKELLQARINGLEEQLSISNNKDFLLTRLKAAKSELLAISRQKLTPISEASISFESIAITKKVEPLETIAQGLINYEKSVPNLVKKCEENITCPEVKNNQATYVGAQTCKTCHQQAFDVWQKAKFIVDGKDEQGNSIKREIGHSKAWKTLSDIHKDTDRSCIGCHSIGFMQPGGYCKTNEVDFRKDVQCESCHGPGSLHAQSGNKALIKRNVSEETCRSCHHVPHITSFDSFNYDKQVIKILGPGHGEKLLEQILHKNNKK